MGEPVPPIPAGGEEPLPAEVQRYIDVVYGPRGHDRADWAHRTARVLLAGGQPAEAMPRDQYGNTPSRVAALRRAVTRAADAPLSIADTAGRDARHA